MSENQIVDLLPCPFCGHPAKQAATQSVYCNNPNCSICEKVMTPMYWNRRDPNTMACVEFCHGLSPDFLRSSRSLLSWNVIQDIANLSVEAKTLRVQWEAAKDELVEREKVEQELLVKFVALDDAYNAVVAKARAHEDELNTVRNGKAAWIDTYGSGWLQFVDNRSVQLLGQKELRLLLAQGLS